MIITGTSFPLVPKKAQRSGLPSSLSLWAQECLTKEDTELSADRRFPRTDHEIATKMLKVCKTGRFGIIFLCMFLKVSLYVSCLEGSNNGISQ